MGLLCGGILIMTENRLAAVKSFSTKTIKKILLYIFIICLCALFMTPFLIMLSRSFMNTNEVIMDLPERFLPSMLNFEAYEVWLDSSYIQNFINTVFIIILNLIGIPLSASLCAFGFTKLRFAGRDIMFLVVLSTLMIPSITMQIPLYMIYYKLGWTNTIIPLFLPAWFGGGAINIFMLKQFMRGIQNDIVQAAKIDGASFLLIYAKIVLPICRPMLTLIMVQTFMACWNDYSGALMFLSGSSRSNYTLALALFYDFQNGSIGLNAKMAAGVIIMIPCFAVFGIFQKYMIFGVNIGAVKG